MKRVFTYLSILILSTACVDDFENNESIEPCNIRMAATIGNPITQTRALPDAIPWRGTTPKEGNPLEVKLLMSLESGLYEQTPTSTNFLPCHTSIKYIDSSFSDPEDVEYTPAGGSLMTGKPKYPTTRDANDELHKVYCSGLYPKDGWTITHSDGASTASIAVDGSQDIMYASEIEGSRDKNFKPQTYDHVLTWIRVRVCSMSQAATEVWGNVERVWINSAETLNVNLKTKELSGANSNDHLIHDTVVPLDTSVTSVGSIFCVPATSYSVKIKVSNFVEPKTVTINPPAGASSFLPGRLYVLEVYFDTTQTEGSCSLIHWDYDDEDLKLS